MRMRLLSFLTLLALMPTSLARAQCSGWMPGPMDTGGTLLGANSFVFAFTTWDPDGTGPQQPMLVAGGDFTFLYGVSASPYIAARDPGTGLWHAIGSGFNNGVRALTVYNGQLIAGGYFTMADGHAANYIARWDGSTWQPMGGGFNGAVLSLAVYGSQLVAGGIFTTADGSSANYIAAWNGSSWQPLGTGTDSYVYCLQPFSGGLAVGGAFGHAGGLLSRYAAFWNGSSWSAMDMATSGYTKCMAIYNGSLYAGGLYGGSVPGPGITRWNGSAWVSLGSGTETVVDCMTVWGNLLVLGGGFTTAGGITVNHMATWDGTYWNPLGSGTDNRVFAVATQNDEIVAGGYFLHASGMAVGYMARWNGLDWWTDNGGAVDHLTALGTFMGSLVAGGDFDQPGDPPADDVAGWNGSTISAFGGGLPFPAFTFKAFKYSGLLGSNELIAGGSFRNAGGIPANFIARWDRSSYIYQTPAWQAMGAGFNSPVFAIERFNNVTYAGGPFTVSSSAVSHVASWNESSKIWQALGLGTDGVVYALKAYGGYLYVGGSFTTAGGVSTGGLARWDGASWSAVGGYFNGTVYSLEVYNGQLVIGGLYPGINSSPNLAQYNGASYSTFGTGGTDGAVRALCVNGTRLYIGGEFSNAGGGAASHIAYWDGSWHGVAGGVDGIVYGLTAYNGEVEVGGTFTHAGGGAIPARGWARFTETGKPWFSQQPYGANVLEGANVTFTGQAASGFSGVTYQWCKGSAPLSDGATGTGSYISGAHTNTLNLSLVSEADQGIYQLVAADACGPDSSFGAQLTVSGASGVAGNVPGVTRFEALEPNPALGATRVAFALARPARVRVSVHDVSGRLVRVMDEGALGAGEHLAAWDARGDDARPVRAGLYFVGLEVDGRSIGIKRLTVVR